jgi:uncharacterized membrane protein
MSRPPSPTEPQQRPVTAEDEKIGINAAIAATITRYMGSMPALYVVLTLIGLWMTAATWGPLRSVDPYPFGFLLFLDHLVQLILCPVILVGQRVLGRAADRRALQSYERAELIFTKIAELHDDLDQHDRALKLGHCPADGGLHPWIKLRQVKEPPKAMAVGLNGRVAAWLTQRLGTMAMVYATMFISIGWTFASIVGVQRFDRYPFEFMTFLSTLAQLIFMVIIMIGQDVLGRAGDQRSEQTFLDTEAILHECDRIGLRLAAQHQVVGTLTNYATTQVSERMARAIYSPTSPGTGAAADHEGRRLDRTSPPLWDSLPEDLKKPARAQARTIGQRLAQLGCVVVPASEDAVTFAFTEDEVNRLARLDHEDWLDNHLTQDDEGPGILDSVHDNLVDWEDLTDEGRSLYLEAVRRIPSVLADAGFQVLRHGRAPSPELADFTAEEWATLQRALMATGLLIALARGVLETGRTYDLVTTIRQTGDSHSQLFIRDLTASVTNEIGLKPGIRYVDYVGPTLMTIRSAVDILERKAPAELPDYRELLYELAGVAVDPRQGGGFADGGGRTRTPDEVGAILSIRRAAGEPTP